MELKESVAHRVIYGLSMIYKLSLLAGVLLFIVAAFMAVLAIPDSDSLLYNESISDDVLGYSFVISFFLVMISFVFRYLRETVRVKTRKFRKTRCRT